MSVLPDDQMYFVINCLTAKSTWNELILYHEGPSDVKESRVMDLKLCYNTFKFKEDNIYETEKNKSLVSATPLSTAFFSSFIIQDFQDSLDDEEDTRSSHEYLNDLEEEYQARALLAKSKRFFKKGLKDLVFVKSSADDTKVTIPGVERPWLSKVEGFIPPNHDTDESSVCSIPLPPLKKLDGAEPISGPKTIKSILRSKSTFKVKALKNVTINEPSSAPAKGKKALQLQNFTQLLLHLKSLGRMYSRPNIPRPSKRFFPPCVHYGGIDHLSNECLYYPISYGSPNHTTTDHYDIKWFKRGEALQAEKAKALKSTRAESSNANRSKTLTKSGCSRHMTGVKGYLHKYMEQPGPKVVFGDDFTCTTEGYGSIKCNGIVFTKFDEKSGTIINSNKKIVMIAPQAFKVFNTRRQQTKETYHIIFDESPEAIKFSKPLVDNINIAESKRYLPDEYLYPY
nr:retrovirus-related Pol polyprotein from transposon TNT 1-94 [Tanacetum cinerariifolium]